MCKYSAEIQAVHFGASHQQATLHTGVLYVHSNSSPVSFCSVSASRLKGPPAIWQHLSPVLDYVQSTYLDVTTVHFYSDGPCTQYRQRGNLFMLSTELFSRGFKAGTWNYFEASHGKGAPDGIGGALKRTADSLVCKGTDIPGATELYSALQKSGTSVKLFFVDAEDIDNAVLGMPSDLPPLPCTMKMHQAVTIAHGELVYRDVSCLCTAAQNLYCNCFDAKHFTFTKAVPTASTSTTDREWQRPEAIGQWCVLKYDADLYPGVIMDIDETHVKVRSMAKIGSNRFFWPARDDILWSVFDDIVAIIPPPKPVTSRHMEVDKDIWAKLLEEVSL